VAPVAPDSQRVMSGGPLTDRIAAESQRVVAEVDRLSAAFSATVRNPPDACSPANTVCDEAKRLVYGDRQKAYDHPAVNFARIAQMVNLLLAKKLRPGQGVLPEEVALILIAVKYSRLINEPTHRDSLVDLCGYALCSERIVRSREGAENVGS
jgi:hypothetical protein